MAAEPAGRWRAGRRRARPARLNLALQGGGAHGAFTWGVLDRLLEDEGFAFEGVSGTSAGALNAVTLASGWLAGGAAGGARRARQLVARGGGAGPLQPAARRRHDPDGGRFRRAAAVALPAQPAGPQSDAQDPRPAGRFRAPAARPRHRAVRRRDRPAQRRGAHLPQPRADHRRAARLGLSAAAASGGHDRRRGLLGRWLRQQPAADPAGRGLPHARPAAGADQSDPGRRRAEDRARHPQPDERDRVRPATRWRSSRCWPSGRGGHARRSAGGHGPAAVSRVIACTGSTAARCWPGSIRRPRSIPTGRSCCSCATSVAPPPRPGSTPDRATARRDRPAPAADRARRPLASVAGR